MEIVDIKKFIGKKDSTEIIQYYDAFDKEYYLSKYVDVREANMDAFFHYTKHGCKEGRHPNRWFNPNYYLDKYQDIFFSGAEPLVHYLTAGKDEKRLYAEPLEKKEYPAYRIDVPMTYTKYCHDFDFISVDIIMPIHNALEDVMNCIESLYHTQTYAFNLIVVDDASDEETRDYLYVQSIERGFTLIVHEENQRFTYSVNSGLKESKAEYVILLNSDTIVTSNWIEKILACFESDIKIGIVGPLSNAASWQSVPQRSKPEGGWMINEIPEGSSIEEMNLLIETLAEESYPKVPSVNGFCYAIKREVIEDIGVLDTHYFPTGYGEEDDYSLRARDAGYEMAIANDTYIYHAKSKSYTHEIREELTANGRVSLDKKHGKEKIDTLISSWKENTDISFIAKRMQSIVHYAKINKKVVYTAIFGNYDALKKPEYINKDWDYVCFTDNKALKSDIYTIKYIEPIFANSTKNARMFKLLSHIFLVNYDYSLWIDGSVKIRGKNIDTLISNMKKKREYISIHKHIKRDCIYDEGMACILADKAESLEVLEQLRYYKEESFPEKRGLIESAEILRNHRNIKTQEFNKLWWQTLDTFTLRDQLSFNYICWKYKFSYHIMEAHQWLDPYFHLYKHGAKIETQKHPKIAIAMLIYQRDIDSIKIAINHFISNTQYPDYSITLFLTYEDEFISRELTSLSNHSKNIIYTPSIENSSETEILNTFLSKNTELYSVIINDKVSMMISDWLLRLSSHILENKDYMAVGPIIFNKEYLITSSSISIKRYSIDKIEYVEHKKIGGHGRVDAISPIGALINTTLFKASKKLDTKYDLKTAWIKFCAECKNEGKIIRFDTDSELIDLQKESKFHVIYL